jgi:hypothetical protein
MNQMSRHILTSLISITAAACLWLPSFAASNARQTLGKPDLKAIELAVNDESSKYYYPELLKQFLSNDTIMTTEGYQYLYYGTFFQEDYDPYRASVDQKTLESLAPIYAKEKRTRDERQKMLNYAVKALADNPLDLRQLTNRVYVYEQNGKIDLAKIWQHKLNHLLLVIAASGTGLDSDNAWIVVYPQHEYDFLNISGYTATAQQFEPPQYDHIIVEQKTPNDPSGYYFDISEMLRQYFIKHPSELNGDDEADDEDEELEDEEQSE